MNDRSSGNRIAESPRSLTHPGTGRLASLVFRGPARLARGTLAAVLTSLRSLRRPGWSERPAPFNPTRSAKEAGDTRWPAKLLIRAGLEGAGRLGDGGPLNTVASKATEERSVGPPSRDGRGLSCGWARQSQQYRESHRGLSRRNPTTHRCTGGTRRLPRGRPKTAGFRDHENLRFSNDLTPGLKPTAAPTKHVPERF